jgi:hypothetical protein
MLILACVAIALGGLIAIESRPGKHRGHVAIADNAIRRVPVAVHGGDRRQVQSWVDSILARPLFEPSRRPPPPVAGPGTAASGFPRLTGIIIMPQQREAIFAVPGKAQPVVVTAGSRLNGVLIKSIEAGWIVVVDAAGAQRVRPSFSTGTATAAVPSASIMVDLPPVPPPTGTSPFASIRGLSGRPLGLVAQPDAPPDGGAITTVPSLPALASPGGSP